jgi:YVTN family beta-propeller protein
MFTLRTSILILLLSSSSLMGGTEAYVGLCCSEPSQISVFNTVKGINRKLPAPANALNVTLSPDGSIAYLAAPSMISALDTTTGVVLGSVPLETFGQPVISRDGKTLYVVSGTGVDFIDTSSFQVTQTVALNLNYPGNLALSPDGSQLYVAGYGLPPDGLNVVNTATGQTSLIPLPNDNYSSSVLVTPDGGKLVVLVEGVGLFILDTATGQSLSQIPLASYCGANAYGMTLSPDGKLVYLTVILNCSAQTDGLVAFDLSSGKLLFQTSSPGLGFLVMSPDGGRIYTVAGSHVYALSAANGSLIQTIKELGEVTTVAVYSDGTLYILDKTNSAVAAVDVATGQLLATTPVGTGLDGLGFDPGGTGTWAFASNRLLVLNAQDQIQSFTPDFFGSAIAFSSANGMAYVATGPVPGVIGFSSGLINVVDVSTRTVSAQIDLPYPSSCTNVSPAQFVMSPAGDRLYVGTTACPGSDPPGMGNVYEINTATNSIVPNSITFVFGVGPLAITPDGSTLFRGGAQGQIARIDTATFTVLKTLQFTPSNADWFGLAVSPDGTMAYAVDKKGATVVAFDPKSGSQTASLQVGTSPFLVAFTPDGTQAYVLDSVATSISVIDTATNTVAGTIPVGGPATDVVFGTN